MKIGEPHHFRWLEGVIAAVFILNVIDGVLTITWYATGRAVEANPLLAKSIGLHPVVFILVKIVLLLPIAGCSYEIIRLGDRLNNPLLNALLLPGMWLQKLATREPSDDQIEVALVALKTTLEKEEMRNGIQSAA